MRLDSAAGLDESYQFNRSTRLREEPANRKAVVEHIKSNVPEGFPKQGVDIDEETEQQISEMLVNKQRWVEELLGVSLASRVPAREKIVFVDRDTFRNTYSAEEEASRCNSPARYWTTGHIAVGVDPWIDFTVAAHALGHEWIHVIAGKTFIANRVGNDINGVSSYSSGFENFRTGGLKSLNETITEMMNIDSSNYGRERGGPDYLNGAEVGYAPGVLLFDMMFDRMAKIKGVDPMSIKGEIYRGYLRGDPSVLRVFKEVYPQTWITNQIFGKGLFSLQGLDPDPFTFELVAKNTGVDLDAYNKKLKDYLAGEEVTLCTGAKLKRPERIKVVIDDH